MSLQNIFNQDIILLRNLLKENENNITKATKAFCEIKNIEFTDTHRRAASKALSGSTEIPGNAVITGGWIKSKAESIRFTVPKEQIDTKKLRSDLVNDLKKFSPKVSKRKKINIGDCLLEICMPDFHIGRDVFEKEKELFETAFWSLVDRAEANYDIAKIELPIGNDFLNSDNIKYTTTKGTQQFDYQKWYESFRNAWQLLASNIHAVSEIAPVNVRSILGNHDQARMFYLGDVLDAYFNNDGNVDVFNDVNKFHHFKFGKNLVMYDHGELKASDYPLIMATEFPIEWSKTDFKEVHTGHFHKEMINEYRGVKVRYLPSLAKNSDWEKIKGYKHIRQAQALVWHKTHGLVDILQYNIIS